jgi:hypothetical protein
MIKKEFKLILILIFIMETCACTLHGMKIEKTTVSNVPLNTGVRDSSFLTDMEKEIIVELNTARTDPKRYADYLKGLRGRSQWTQGLEEAILLIDKKEPLPPLKASKGLSLAARDLVKDRGPKGLTGHTGRDDKSMFDRMNGYGQWEEKAGEFLSYGYRDAEAVVARIAIDESATGKDGKEYIFDKDFLVVGVACGPHETYRIMCAIDFARAYKEKPDIQ